MSPSLAAQKWKTIGCAHRSNAVARAREAAARARAREPAAFEGGIGRHTRQWENLAHRHETVLAVVTLAVLLPPEL